MLGQNASETAVVTRIADRPGSKINGQAIKADFGDVFKQLGGLPQKGERGDGAGVRPHQRVRVRNSTQRASSWDLT